MIGHDIGMAILLKSYSYVTKTVFAVSQAAESVNLLSDPKKC